MKRVKVRYPDGNIREVTEIYARDHRLQLTIVETKETEEDLREKIIEDLKAMDIKVHPNTGLKKLQEKLKEAEEG